MRTRQRKWLLFGGLLTVIFVAVIFLALGQREPAYKGKKLSKWLNELAALDYSRRWDLHTEQAQAVRAIGTNAFPWLFSPLREPGSRWQWQLNKLLARQSIINTAFQTPTLDCAAPRPVSWHWGSWPSLPFRSS